MRYEIRVQDPTPPARSTLFDAVVDIAEAGAVEYARFFFGFLTGSGMDALRAVPAVESMFLTASIDVLVGLDAVTDRAGLESLLSVAVANSQFNARVIKNTTGALVHPKMLFARYVDGSSVAVVGSNNLSYGGLSGNVEGYSIGRFDAGEQVDLSDWDAFIAKWLPRISEIDQEALDAADRNATRLDRLKSAAKAAPGGTTGSGVVLSDGQAHETEPTEDEAEELMLVSVVPAAGKGKGARWSQVHLSADVLREFFGVEPDSHAVVQLREVGGSVVEDRPIVYSPGSNMNVKIEVGAAREAARTVGYPDEGRPIVVFRWDGSGLRYRYLLLMPGDSGHAEISALAVKEFTPKGNQLPRVITPRSHVLAAWPDCPI